MNVNKADNPEPTILDYGRRCRRPSRAVKVAAFLSGLVLGMITGLLFTVTASFVLTAYESRIRRLHVAGGFLVTSLCSLGLAESERVVSCGYPVLRWHLTGFLLGFGCMTLCAALACFAP